MAEEHCRDFPTDLHIYEAIKSGDKQRVSKACSCLYQKFIGIKKSIGNRYKTIINHWADIEDEVYLVSLTILITKIQNGQFVLGKSAISTYFYGIFGNTCKSIARGQGGNFNIDTINPELISDYHEQNKYIIEEQEKEKEQERNKLRVAMEKLSKGCFDVLYRRYFKKESLAQIAAARGVSVGTIKTDIHRCKEKLRDFLK